MLKLSVFKQNKKLCVASVLKEYIDRTKELRSGTRLFVAYIVPHKGVSRDTISRWIRTIMQSSGIDVKKFTPHSTRAASTSKAFDSNVPLGAILKTAGWSKESTFNKFYNKPVEEQKQDKNFAQAILE